MRLPFSAVIAGLVAAHPANARSQSAPALPTAVTTVGDTIVAKVSGPVPAARVHTLVAERTIAPGVDDTTLFTQVQSFRVDRAGRFWVFDQPTASVFLFDKDGKLVKHIGRQGSGPGEMRSDNGSVILPGDRFAIWDAQNGRVSGFAANGTFEKSTVVSKGFYTFNGLVTDRTGALFVKNPVARGADNRIGTLGLIRIRDDGTLGDSLTPPDLRVSPPTYTASRNGATATYNSRNSAGAAWAWHPDGYFVTVDGSRSRIIFSRRNAKPIVVQRQLPPVRIPPEERADDEAFITWGLRQTVPDWKFTGAPVPDTKPSLAAAAVVTRDGNVWARVATPSERIPDAELPESRNGRPVYHFRSPNEWEVYSPDGRFLARVRFPMGFQIMEADGNTVWGLSRDADDLPVVGRYRIQPALPARRP
jgi:hypothetical protein